MKAKPLVGCAVILVFGLVLMNYLWPIEHPAAAGASTEQKSTSAAAEEVTPAGASVPIPVTEPVRTRPTLDQAKDCAQFVLGVAEKVPQERASARHQVQLFAAALFVNDYIMAATADPSVPLVASAIVAAFTNATATAFGTNGPPRELLKALEETLSVYNRRSETLAEHYARLTQRTVLGSQVRKVKGAIVNAGIEFNPESPLLLDCSSYVSAYSGMNDSFGPAESEKRLASVIEDYRSTAIDKAAGVVSSPNEEQNIADRLRQDDRAELEESTTALTKIMRWRLSQRYGVGEQVAGALVEKLSTMTIANASPADLQIPAAIQ